MLAVLFDTETNGLIENRALRLDKQPEIFEWYSCVADLSTGTVQSELEFMCKPRGKLLKEVVKVTGVTDEMLADKLPFGAYANQVREFIARAPNIAGHNINHDVECTEIEFERLRQPPLVWPYKICTVEATIHIKGHRMRLGDLHEHLFGERFPDAHRAKNDVMGHLRICTELFRREMI